MSDRFKRIIAFIIDLNLAYFPLLIIFFSLTASSRQVPPRNAILILLNILPVILFVIKDVIFNGRSLGKRIFGLCVYDKSSLDASVTGERLLLNIFLFIPLTVSYCFPPVNL